jgi:hypothetical protein
VRLTVLRRTAVVAALPLVFLVASALPAEAMRFNGIYLGGLAQIDIPSGNGTVSGACAYSATLPDTDITYLSIAFDGSATARTAKMSDVVPVSTSIRCCLRNPAYGEAAITVPGPTATVAGTGEVYRRAPDPEICVVAWAAFSNGVVVGPSTACHNL